MARVLLISTYEQGHQPLSIAAPAAALTAAGHEVSAFDLAVESVSSDRLHAAAVAADLIGISTPMHTAARLGIRIARQLTGMSDKVVFYGHAASSLDDLGLGRAISGDTDLQLVGLAGGEDASDVPLFDRELRPVPNRSILPPLEQYARYRDVSGGSHVAGYVEATRGCAHRCTHCPLTPIYAGRLRLNGADAVLADIDQQVLAGAEHITFGDPDFLNAPGLAMDLLRETSAQHPGTTFDTTIKVEHLIEHQELLPEMAELGVTFITSAFESVDDRLLEILDKGHTADDLDLVLQLTERAGIALRPTWLPFTPWTTPAHFLDLLRFVETRKLVDVTPPVQLGLRLLVPWDSPLVDPMREMGSLTTYDSDGLTWNWRHEDARMDDLQGEIAGLAERQATFAQIKDAACRRLEVELWPDVAAPHVHRPGLTEDWFC